MESTMKAAVVREFGKPLVMEEVAVPRPGAGQILVKIAATGMPLRAIGRSSPIHPSFLVTRASDMWSRLAQV